MEAAAFAGVAGRVAAPCSDYALCLQGHVLPGVHPRPVPTPCLRPAAPACAFLQIFASIPACIDLLEGPYIETHEEVVKTFRPPALRRAVRPAPAAQ